MLRLHGFMLSAAGGALIAVSSAGAALAQDAMIDVSGSRYAGSTVFVGSVTAPADGFVVIHSVEDGQIGAPLGHAAVTAGANQNVQVTLDAAPQPGQVLAAMLHEDTNANGEFDSPQTDKPVMSGGSPVVNRFQIAEGEAVQAVTVEDADADGATVGAAGGAVAGAVAGGPVGAIVGAVAGAAAGAALDAPPETVQTYVVGQDVPSVTLSGDLVVGAGLPDVVQLYEIPDYEYRLAVVNDQRVLVDPETRQVVYIFE